MKMMDWRIYIDKERRTLERENEKERERERGGRDGERKWKRLNERGRKRE